MTKLINHGWNFSLDGSPPKPVDIPHDWLIGDAHNHYKSGIGKYTTALDLEKSDNAEKVSLRFDGVYMDSTLRVNGKTAGEWKYGYTTFEFDITDFITFEKPNEIELTVNFDGQSARWYTGAGIYRDVWLITRNANHFVPDGIYVTTAQKDGVWTWQAQAEVVSDGRPYEVLHTLVDSELIEPWDIDNPRLYTLRSELLVEGQITDTVEQRIGFRTTEFTTDRGFFLNGKYVKIKGVCQHHDLGSLGAAFYKDAARRQLDILRGMGVNAIRTAHNPPAPGLMDLCDEMGFVVMSELTDIWQRAKTPGDYSRFFDEWVDKDAASWIRRDRNRPSVILWSVGNEIHDTHVDFDKGTATLQRLLDLVKKHDPEVNAPATLCSNYMTWENTQKCVDLFNIIGYNYNENLYHDHHKKYPHWVIYGGETCSTLQSRGIYHFPLSRAVLADDDLQCSSLGNTTTSWGTKNVPTCIRDDFDAPFSLGQFVWSGIDYLGEPTPYHTKNCYFGQVDTAGFEKDSYYIFKAAWTDYKKDPFVHVFPYWDFSPGQLIDVRVCSNAPRVSLFLDDEKIGDADLTGEEKWIASWQIPYKKGTLTAKAYDENGNDIATQKRTSFGDVSSLKTETLTYGELDFTTITALDADGNIVENANCRVNVTVDEGRQLTLDNGDSTDYDSYHATSRRMFSGKLLLITTAKAKFRLEIDTKDIPIRKIELSSSDGSVTNNSVITAKIHPANATYSDLAWRLTDAGGIDSPMGALEISKDGFSASLMPKGDGTGYVRCSTQNGLKHPAIISVLEAKVTGLGDPFLNPYEFLSAGLYNACNFEPGSGIDRGVATRRLDETHVGFKGVDFGSFGSDEITLWLFPMGGDPFEFEIWEGMPNEDGVLLHTAYYDKGSIWNTYIEASYKLPRRLKGVTTLCLIFRDKVHIKGFAFKKPNKAFSKLYAAENDLIYGDNFKIAGKCVEGIGNNVSITYNDMDFGEKGANEVSLRWRSALSENSVRIDFENEKGTVTQMLSLTGSGDYKDVTYKLSEPLIGKGKLMFVFLPGCNLDIESIEFN
ncbi:MAG: DUF4982 domain-containing protein [Oscillospiraceae bacterium]|nr:DUF4982 domain-containing protein [Oscillospiraceae bacterium]